MALGTPIIASTSGGQAELLDASRGYLFSWTKENDLEQTLLDALASNNTQEKNKAALLHLQNSCSYSIVLQQREQLLSTKGMYTPYVSPRYGEVQFTTRLLPVTEIKLAHELYGETKNKKHTIQNYSQGKTTERQTIPELLSIIVTTTNPTKTLVDRLQQIMTTDYAKKEIILIDAGTWLPESAKLLQSLVKQKISL